MHTPASTKVLKKILGVKWELGGGVVGLKLLLTIPTSRICQIFGVSAASRVRQFQNHLGFRPRGRPRREMRQRCGVVSTSKSRPLAPHERHPLAAPPPASLSSAAASAACIDGCTAASVAIKCGRVSGLHTRGSDTHGSDTRGSDTRGSAHGIGRGRESEGRAGAQPGQGRKKRALAAAAECSWGHAFRRTFTPKLVQR